MRKFLAPLFTAVIATYGVYAYAQMKADARPAMSPIGTASSNGISFAWFYDPPTRTVVVCRVGQASGDTVGLQGEGDAAAVVAETRVYETRAPPRPTRAPAWVGSIREHARRCPLQRVGLPCRAEPRHA